jgi:hypothetical protein
MAHRLTVEQLLRATHETAFLLDALSNDADFTAVTLAFQNVTAYLGGAVRQQARIQGARRRASSVTESILRSYDRPNRCGCIAAPLSGRFFETSTST